MDEQSFHHHQATSDHHRFESRHDLRLSGSCSDEVRSLRLERIGYAYRRVAIAPFGPLPRKREGAFLIIKFLLRNSGGTGFGFLMEWAPGQSGISIRAGPFLFLFVAYLRPNTAYELLGQF